MAIVIPDEIAATRTTKVALVKENKIYRLSVERKLAFYVLSSPGEDEDDILSAVGLPQIFSPYRGTYCKTLDIKESEPVMNPYTGQPGILSEVECGFDNNFSADDQEDQENPPEERRPKISWHGENEDEVLEKDAETGEPIQTVAREPIIMTAPVVYQTLQIRRFEAFPFEPLVGLLYPNKLNSNTFWGAPTGTAWMQPIEAGEDEEIEGQLYVAVTYRIKFKMVQGTGGQFESDTWKTNTLHQGTQYFDPNEDVTKTVKALDSRGEPVTILLAGDGTPLDASLDPQYLRFNRFKKIDFDALNLGPFY